MSTLKFKNIDGYYEEELERDGIAYKKKTTDKYLSVLADIFNEGDGWTEAVKHSLLKPLGKGISNDLTQVIIENDKVIIRPQFEFGITKENTIETDKRTLLDLINKWQKLVEQQCKEIIFTRYEDDTITLTGN